MTETTSLPFTPRRPVILPRFQPGNLSSPLQGGDVHEVVWVPYPVARTLGAWALQLEDEALRQANLLIQTYDPSAPAKVRVHPLSGTPVTETELENEFVMMFPWDPEFELLRACYPDHHASLHLTSGGHHDDFRTQDGRAQEPREEYDPEGFNSEPPFLPPLCPVESALEALLDFIGAGQPESGWDIRAEPSLPADHEVNLGRLLSGVRLGNLNLAELPAPDRYAPGPLRDLAALGGWTRTHREPKLPVLIDLPDAYTSFNDIEELTSRLRREGLGGYTAQSFYPDDWGMNEVLLSYNGEALGLTSGWAQLILAELSGHGITVHLDLFPEEEELPF